MRNNIVDSIKTKKLKRCTMGDKVLNANDTLMVIDYLDNQLSDIDFDINKAYSNNYYLLSAMQEIFGRFGAYVH